jgi:hypothetical protein
MNGFMSKLGKKSRRTLLLCSVSGVVFAATAGPAAAVYRPGHGQSGQHGQAGQHGQPAGGDTGHKVG